MDILQSQFLMKLQTALSYLPNVKPRIARQDLEYEQRKLWARQWEMEEQTDSEFDEQACKVILGNTELTCDDFRHILESGGDLSDTPKVTPYGASLLIKLYNDGYFELKGKSQQPSTIDQQLIDYTASEQKISEQEKDHKRQLKAYKTLIKNPDRIKLEEFSYYLLNDVFVEHFGYRQGTFKLDIGGVSVTKGVTVYSSNSRKSQDSEVIFSWTDLDGNYRELKQASFHKSNRRNDERRNWGLHE
ncbi:hypothetical protein H0A36_27785 [Endozoicomonas sp. SM1973]|uniref:Uncharacterized protein n=1 Tax=Spartinivicinus marinus TaxID=2994442 RepID=A0A853IKB2_9GAMM|nr:hypothetical protein [Spartinivicinus marinus]MCX4030472.1 hypothetical protein [Spartinivicinus marinus]NYZ69817.1 hypothetical protein [Spartinivicinus marinus]